MNLHQAVARAGAIVVAVAAAIGSTRALLAVAHASDVAWEPALPLSLDGVAVVAVMVIRQRAHSLFAWAALVSATTCSASVQWMTAPPGVVPHLVHITPALATLAAIELFQLSVSPLPRPDTGPEQRKEEQDRGAVPGSAGQPRRIAVVGRPAPAPVDDLLPHARKLLADKGLSPHEVSWRGLAELLRNKGHALGTRKATDLLSLLREEVPA